MEQQQSTLGGDSAEQQTFRVRFSVGTKLLLSIVSLLFIVIVFLNVSTILILTNDKRAYIYQSQSKEAVLAGREFADATRHVTDALRLSLAGLDPLKPVTSSETAALQSVVDNQSEALRLSVYMLDLKDSKLNLFTRATKSNEFETLHLSDAGLEVTPEWVSAITPDLLRNSFAFLNLSKVGGPPVIGVMVADLKLKSNVSGMPVAIGIVSLQDFGAQLKGLNLTVATKSGWVLFDSDPTILYSKKNIADDPLLATAIASPAITGASEYVSQGTRYIGSFVQPGFELVVLDKTEWQKAVQATYFLMEKFILLGLMAIGAAVVFALFFSRTLTAPINRLYQATREVAKGNFNVDLKSNASDEIGALTGSFGVMSRKISDLIQESMEKVQLENELAIASTVQQTLMPPSEYRNERIYIKSLYQSASTCGGDWWGFFGVGNKLCIMIADATGHGFPSALITASARSCVSVLHKLAQEDPEFSFSPSAMLSYANRVVYDASMAKILMTFFMGVIDFDTGVLTYSSAGHNPPWLFKHANGKFVAKSLMAVGNRLGEIRDPAPFEEQSVPIGPKDILFLYTDGLMEGSDFTKEMFGKKRVRKVVEAGLSGGPDKIVNDTFSEFMKFNGDKPLDDDVTIAAMLILGPEES